MKPISSYFKNIKVLSYSIIIHFFSWIPSDKMYLKLLYHSQLGRRLNLENPETYNEKIQWLKLYDRRQQYVEMVDKYLVKGRVEAILGKEYVIPTLGVWDDPRDIDWSILPNQFVLKTNHDSGTVVVCRDKDKLDKKAVIKRLRKALSKDYSKSEREWPYKFVPRKVFAEAYMEDSKYGELRDYKLFCFDGKFEFLFVAVGRSTGNVTFDFFDKELNPIAVLNGHSRAKELPELPNNIKEMIFIAEKLSEGYPHIRIDLYNINDKIYFGEYTLYHFGGLVPFIPDKYDFIFGKYLNLPKKATDLV